MVTKVEVRCTDPLRRDALEEAARLILSFRSVTSRPIFYPRWKEGTLRLTVSSAALSDGCYLAEAAQSVLEAVQGHGIEVVKTAESKQGDVPSEWTQWWSALESESPKEFDLVLEII